jgi:predicted nucleic acid-binding protein
MEYYTLDACAVLALLWQENGYESIDEVFEKAKNGEAMLIMHRVTLTEIYDVILKEEGADNADKAIEQILTNSPIKFYDTTADLRFIKTFAQLRAKYGTHFTDSWVVATNAVHATGGTILTADRGFDRIKNDGKYKVQYFR